MGINLRKWARGKECQIRYPGYCNFNSETTVLAHDNLAGISGMGMKAPNECAALACSTCHDVADGRIKAPEFSPCEKRLMFYEGMSRTIAMWSKEIG